MKKRYLIIIIIAIVLVICLGAGFAFAYFATDMFKSNKQLFSKYISNNGEILEIFNDSDLRSYAERQKQNPYTSEGSIKTNVTFPDSSQKQLADALQNCNITFNGKTDIANNYMYYNIKANYSQSQSLNIQLLRNNDIYAFKIDEVLAKFLGVDNNNLKELASKLGLPQDSIASIPNKIDFSKFQDLNVFSDEELSQLKNKYLNIITDNLKDDMFSKEKNNEYSIYTLTLSEEQSKSIASKLLETLKNDELLKNKIRQLYSEKLGLTDENINTLIENYEDSIQSEYEDLTNSLSLDEGISNDSSNLNTSKSESKAFIKVYVEKGKLIKTEFSVSDEEEKFVIVKTDNGARFEFINDEDTSESYNLSLQKIKTNNDLKYNFSFANNNQQLFDLIVTYAGINTNQVHEISELNFEIDANDLPFSRIDATNNDVITTSSKIKFVSTYNNTKSLGSTFEKNDVKNEDIMLINSAPNAQSIQTAFAQISQQFINVNNSKLASIGLNNNINPFMFYIPSVVPASASIIIPYYNNSNIASNTMLVSAGTSISMLIGDNAILHRASEAQKQNEISAKNDENKLELNEITLCLLSLKYDEQKEITRENIQNQLKISNIDANVTENSDKTYTITIKKNNNTYVVNNNGEIISHKFAE